MKKTILLSLLSILAIFSCAGGSNPPGPGPEPDPPGPQPDPPGPTPTYPVNPSKIVITYLDGSFGENYFTYNENNLITKSEEKYFNSNSELCSHYIETYTYNDHNDQLSKIRNNILESKEEINLAFTYQYDARGNILVQTEKGVNEGSTDNNKYVYTYDDLDRVTTYEEHLSNKLDVDPLHWNYRYEYTYTPDKAYTNYEEIKKYTYPDESTSTVILTQELDDQGRVIKSADNYDNETTYTYDEYGCLVSLIISMDKGDEYSGTITSYYKNNPDKPLKEEYRDYTSSWEEYTNQSISDYEYDEHDRVKKMTVTGDLENYTEEYYYEDR